MKHKLQFLMSKTVRELRAHKDSEISRLDDNLKIVTKEKERLLSQVEQLNFSHNAREKTLSHDKLNLSEDNKRLNDKVHQLELDRKQLNDTVQETDHRLRELDTVLDMKNCNLCLKMRLR